MGKAQHSIRFYDFGPFRIDVASRQLLRSGQLISLTPKAFELLSVLVQNAGAVVEKQDLLNAVWPGVSVDEGILSVNIASV
jgi:DNA-binding winged helix-turn-helix (wHTH) protein